MDNRLELRGLFRMVRMRKKILYEMVLRDRATKAVGDGGGSGRISGREYAVISKGGILFSALVHCFVIRYNSG